MSYYAASYRPVSQWRESADDIIYTNSSLAYNIIAPCNLLVAILLFSIEISPRLLTFTDKLACWLAQYSVLAEHFFFSLEALQRR